MNRLASTFALLLSLATSQTLAAQPPSTLADSLQPYVDREELAGAVALVADREGTVLVETFGFADRDSRAPMKRDSVFWIASQTKAMTAAAVMILVDEGKLSLDDPIEKHLPEFKDLQVVAEKTDDATTLKRPLRSVTVRDALCHMSGMPFLSAVEQPTLDGLALPTAVRSYAMTPLLTQPGEAYRYSNAGINTAARIVEVVSGQSHEEFMQKRLFDPLGMRDTTYWPSEEQVARLAKTYKPGPEGKGLVEMQISQLRYPLSERCGRFPMPAGGLFSTAEDVSKFCRMLLRGGELDGRRILSEEAVREMTTRQTPETVKESYGLGLSVGPDWFGHGGAQATNMEVRPNQGLVLVWMVQHAGFPGEGGKAQGAFKEWALKQAASVEAAGN